MKKFHFLVISLFVTPILISSCNDDDDLTEDCIFFEWGYDEGSDPDNWVTCFAECGGQAQSPININIGEAVIDRGLMALDTRYENVPIELTNHGSTIEFEYESGSILRLDGDDYRLLQFHFHTGSEHTVDGLQYPMEAHLVHQNVATGNLAVIGVLFEEGSENAFLANFNNNLPRVTNQHYSSAEMINVENLMPTNGAYYTYGGSLTTPPCSEIVTWFVLKTPVEASSAQIQNMYDILQENYRPTQALNGREIREFN